MEVKLNMWNRIVLSTLLPGQGNRMFLRTIDGIFNKCIPNDAACAERKVAREPNGGYSYDGLLKAFPEIVQVSFNEVEFAIVKNTLKDLDTRNQLNKGHADLFDIFVEEKTLKDGQGILKGAEPEKVA